jgi:hypothetical protein
MAALRDATLWGYALFALMICVLADRSWVLGAMRLYGWVLPTFALWLPIGLALSETLRGSYDPNFPGSNIPLIFWKNQDMAVHAVGAIGFLVLATDAWRTPLRLAGRLAVALRSRGPSSSRARSVVARLAQLRPDSRSPRSSPGTFGTGSRCWRRASWSSCSS